MGQFGVISRATRRLWELAAAVRGTRNVGGRAAASVDVVELLGRKPVNLDTPELQRFLAGKTVLVTGAGGSIGSEICRQSMKFCPRRLVLVERAENALFEIDRELRQQWVGADIRPCVADVCDETRVREIFCAERPDLVFHAAAHKHVPMMELNPGEAVKNNVFGTKIVADAAIASGCDAFVMVSTDKAVNPTNVMGAPKRCAELYVQSLNAGSTRFVAVRSRSNRQKRRADLQAADSDGWAGDGDAPGDAPLLHDHPRGQPARDAGGGHREGWGDLRARHG